MGGLTDRVPATDKIVGEDAQLALRVVPQPVWRGATRGPSYKASPDADDAIGLACKLALYQKGFLFPVLQGRHSSPEGHSEEARVTRICQGRVGQNHLQGIRGGAHQLSGKLP